MIGKIEFILEIPKNALFNPVNYRKRIEINRNKQTLISTHTTSIR